MVLSTDRVPSTTEHRDLTSKIQNIFTDDQLVEELVSVHLVHTITGDTGTTRFTNAYLNLARLFASTNTVALFPNGLSVLPRHHRDIEDLASSTAVDVLVVPPISTSLNAPLIIDSGSAIILPRNATRWCPERFAGLTRPDYEDCLWLFRLYYGIADVEPTLEVGWARDDVFIIDSEPALEDPSPVAVRMKIVGIRID